MVGLKARTAVFAAAVSAVLAGCGTWSDAMTPDTSAAGDCPPAKPGSGHTAVDYVDFVQAHGTSYLARISRSDTLSAREVGPVQFRVRCSLAALNDLTHATPPEPRNHDAAFLPSGTSVYAVRGWSALCRLAARHDGAWHVYLAQRSDTNVATAKNCALHRSPTTAAQR